MSLPGGLPLVYLFCWNFFVFCGVLFLCLLSCLDCYNVGCFGAGDQPNMKAFGLLRYFLSLCLFLGMCSAFLTSPTHTSVIQCPEKPGWLFKSVSSQYRWFGLTQWQPVFCACPLPVRCSSPYRTQKPVTWRTRSLLPSLAPASSTRIK